MSHGGGPIPGFTPENGLERRLAADPVMLEGWRWGKPRRGHPEGAVGVHVAHLLRTIDEWGEAGVRRSELRFLALVHDSLKAQVQHWRPHAGQNHHAALARRFAENLTADERLLATIELHDRPYAIWRRMRRRWGDGERARHALRQTVARIPDRDLFLRFVELDGSTEGKRPEPIDWLRRELGRAR